MDDVKEILKQLLDQKITVEKAEKLLKANLIEEVGELAKLDIFRKTRTGVPEVIYARNKTPEILIKIINSFLENKNYAIISKYQKHHEDSIIKNYPQSDDFVIERNDLAKIIVIRKKTFKFQQKGGIVGIITAGSSDIPVAEEAKEILRIMGCSILASYDVGIAGMHRIFTPLSHMIKEGVDVIIVCAGMEGTLPGVVAALVDIPVIGVPISSGYGLGANGEGALITMLQSCSPGLLVVNIDNGFGAAASAAIIANKVKK